MEAGFNRMASNDAILESIEQMDSDRASGYRGDYEPRDYYHNIRIREFVEENKRIAWRRCLQKLEVQALVAEQAEKKSYRELKKVETTPDYKQLLAMYR